MTFEMVRASVEAEIDGTAWSALGAGVNSNVDAIAVSPSGEVYAGGDFTAAGSLQALGIAKWDGTRWSSLGLGLDGKVRALALAGTTLYAGGDFTRAGGFSANGVARWDGTNWYRLSTGVNGKVYAVAVAPDGRVYVGGDFTTAGGSPANHVAVWDGTNWTTLGGGANGVVAALAVSGTDVFVGGSFASAGGSTDIQNLARWDGTQWWALGGGLGGSDASVAALTVNSSGSLFVSGQFTTAGGLTANHVAAWDGARWYTLGTGLDGPATAIAVRSGELFLGGPFTEAGRHVSWHFGRWSYMNLPPSISLVSPGVGQTFIVPTNLVLQTSVQDFAGVVTQVVFYAGTSKLGTLTNAPYNLTWTNVPIGVYSLSAQATDNGGASTVSSPVVIVVTSNRPPVVTLLTPTNGAAFFVPFNLAINASAFDLDGTVAEVDLYAGTNLLAALTNTPYALVWTNPPPGTYLLSATAIDNLGATTSTPLVTITVSLPAPVQLGSPLLTDLGQFQLPLAGQTNGNVIVEASTNLEDWLPLGTLSLPNGTNLFLDAQSTNFTYRFYRALYGQW